MRAAVFALLVGAASSREEASSKGNAVVEGEAASSSNEEAVEPAGWNDFKLTYGKIYSGPTEEATRKQLYADNKAFVDQHMKEYDDGKHTYTVALNKFADMSTREFLATYTGLRRGNGIVNADRTYYQPSGNAVPDTWDWREKGAVTGVKNQGNNCGSSWAFSATGSLEGAWAVAGNTLLSLSEQQLVDCSSSSGNNGCNGGCMDLAFRYIKLNGGIVSEADYPYTGRDDGTCQEFRHYPVTVIGFRDLPKGDEDALADAVTIIGPISVAIDASHPSFRFYSSGIYNEPKCNSTITSLDLGVLVVGYGTNYWIVKNSLGTDWGKEGYIWMTRNGNNQCGIATLASYPLV